MPRLSRERTRLIATEQDLELENALFPAVSDKHLLKVLG